MDDNAYAIMEGEMIVAVDEYIAARPQLDSTHNRRIYEAGFRTAWNRRAEDVPEGWKDVAVELPKDGQRIIGCSKDFDTWYEVWDSEEPIGATRWWIAAPEVKHANKTF